MLASSLTHLLSRTHSPCSECVPRSVHVSVEVLLGRLARAGTVARVVVGEDVAIDARAQADVKAAHLPKVHSIAVREEQRVACTRRAAHEHAGDAVASRCACHEALDGVLLARRVLPVGALGQVQRPAAAALVAHQRVGGLRWQEGQLGGNLARAWRAAE